eukprot:CAMPEP_0182508388 /NCGR_PEP_ID=MMETSP1321-20130603/24904_1 /TAXON_ID=91990 /ORGANISM="Bolidomonas sp., Strain RCC1657" /LENGTH=239 /DNA_ID=CAMNT_0024714455 /DNA_START=109 /DNA_END=825 /DNA_ORIENTATION=+
MFNSAYHLRPISSLMPSLNCRRSTSARFATTTTATSTSDNVDKIDDADEKLDIVQLDPDVVDNLKHPFLKTMRDRGYLFQCTNLKALDVALLSSPPTSPLSAYLGFDATADSLHVGSLLQIMILRHLQRSGARPVVLVGGATSKVGDPTGKDESRKMLDDGDIGNNIKGISKVFETFINFEEDNEEEGQPRAKMVNNEDWLGGLKYLNFLRDYGTYFTVNRMLSFESVKQRMARENPLS